jgi:hypothetical protein
MDESDIDMIPFAIELWEDTGRADAALCALPIANLDLYIHQLPPAMCRDLAELDFVRSPPNTIDDFFVIRSSNYRGNFLEGLTEEQILDRMRDEELKFKQRDFFRYWALHDYFYGTAQQFNPADA